MRLEPLSANVIDPRGNPSTPEKVTLGRLLFFDPILSADGTVACATCHDPRFGWADGRSTPLGMGGAGKGPERVPIRSLNLPPLVRNTPTVLNAGFLGLVAGAPLVPEAAPLFWDGREHGLEAQVAHPLNAAAEMGGPLPPQNALESAAERLRSVPAYQRLFQAAFGEVDATITGKRLAQALAAFERSLKAGNTAVDRFLGGDPKALSALSRQGLEVFQSAGCAHCHGGPMFSDFQRHVLGFPDGERSAVRTPSLRNLTDTAPYMHNGALRSLEDVLAFYDQLQDTVSETLDGGDDAAQPPLDPLLRRLHLRTEDIPSLLAFLRDLQSPDYGRSIPSAVPSGLDVGGK